MLEHLSHLKTYRNSTISWSFLTLSDPTRIDMDLQQISEHFVTTFCLYAPVPLLLVYARLIFCSLISTGIIDIVRVSCRWSVRIRPAIHRRFSMTLNNELMIERNRFLLIVIFHSGNHSGDEQLLEAFHQHASMRILLHICWFSSRAFFSISFFIVLLSLDCSVLARSLSYYSLSWGIKSNRESRRKGTSNIGAVTRLFISISPSFSPRLTHRNLALYAVTRIQLHFCHTK